MADHTQANSIFYVHTDTALAAIPQANLSIYFNFLICASSQDRDKLFTSS